jgi:hypothetical protein
MIKHETLGGGGAGGTRSISVGGVLKEMFGTQQYTLHHFNKNHLECVRHVNYSPMFLWQIEVVQLKSDNCAFICHVFGVKQGSMIFLQGFNIIYSVPNISLRTPPLKWILSLPHHHPQASRVWSYWYIHALCQSIVLRSLCHYSPTSHPVSNTLNLRARITQ